ncbi:MAG TPA: hypothetical protein VKH82_01525, partial [Candidatus Binatia bacterium]|nr:hypothetical protein [Candidatus Binatia bacterium]
MHRSRSRSRLTLVGACRRCGVRFGASPLDVQDTRLFLDAHEQVCPGGSRACELVIPLGPVR